MNNTTHRVYWTEDGEAQFKDFDSAGLVDSLKFCESLRKARREGANISFITVSSEIAECTSLQGVDVTGPDYDWKKRRK